VSTFDPSSLALSPREEELGFLQVALQWQETVDAASGETVQKMLPCVICILDTSFSSVLRVPHPDGQRLCYMLHIHGVHRDHPELGITWHGIENGIFDDAEQAVHQARLILETSTFPIQRIKPSIDVLPPTA
jgi:hypothetical protein